jgi:hypothetical protein
MNTLQVSENTGVDGPCVTILLDAAFPEHKLWHTVTHQHALIQYICNFDDSVHHILSINTEVSECCYGLFTYLRGRHCYEAQHIEGAEPAHFGQTDRLVTS